MTGNESPEIPAIGRRTVLRNGLLIGFGVTAAGATAASLAGTSLAATTAPQAQASPDTAAPVQHDWAWCNACSGMFYTNSSGGVCPAFVRGASDINPHADLDDYNSYNYGIYYNAVTTSSWQGNWWWCWLCQGLFHGNKQDGKCPNTGGLGNHDGTKSYPYVLYHGSGDSEGQPNWLWCSVCYGLFYAGSNAPNHINSTTGGWCPVNNGGVDPHYGSGSWPYQVGWSGSLALGPPVIE
jgi:hypothetical protein